ncbi:MAG: ribosome biogenesis GTPase Der [Calditrichaceae bacterium]
MSEPIVAIVGRPNVGKSTLFNRLIGSREAIVDDKPGVTRDRNYGHVNWNGRQFALIDTGGYLPEGDSMIDAAIREQVDIAIDESDVVLFVVDAKTGITDTDERIAGMLLRSNKDTMVVVNKVDDAREDVEVGQFYRLGLGDPQPVSAMIGRQTGDFLDVLIKKLKQYDVKEVNTADIKLAIIGKENVGKSSLVNTFLEQNRSIVTNIPGTTRDSIDSKLTYYGRDYILIDTAGLKKKAKIKENILFYSNLRTFRSIQRADVVIYMVDVNDGISRQDISVLGEAAANRKGVVLVLNKWDLISKDDKTMETYRRDHEERMGVLRYIPQIFVSVLEKQRLFKVLDLATEVYEERKKRIDTSGLNEYFRPLIQKHSPPAVKGKEIKINYITQIMDNPPMFVFFSNFPNLIGESYKRFLENKLREQYGYKGVPINLVFRKK